MPKIKDKNFYESDHIQPTYEIYGTRRYTERIHDYEESWTENKTDFLIYQYGSWNWVDSDYYIPAE